jgi:predicted GNAT family acetyltransferase
MTMRTGNRVVRDNPAELQYELRDGGEVVGLIRYRREPGAIALVHTDVDPDLEGTGAAGELVEGALLDLRSRDLRVIPICPYVRSWIGRHPAYADLVIDDPAPPE